jgi:hypothetical protein
MLLYFNVLLDKPSRTPGGPFWLSREEYILYGCDSLSAAVWWWEHDAICCWKQMYVSFVCVIVYVNKYMWCGSNCSMAVGNFGCHPSDYLKRWLTSFKNVVEFKYFKMASTLQNCMQEDIKSRLNCGNVLTFISELCLCLLSMNNNVSRVVILCLVGTI